MQIVLALQSIIEPETCSGGLDLCRALLKSVVLRVWWICVWNPTAQEVEAEQPWAWSKASLEYIVSPCLKTNGNLVKVMIVLWPLI